MILVVINNKVWIPGDERSRTHPGHGYPEHSVDTQSVKEFADESSFMSWASTTEKTYRVYEAKELTVVKKTTIEFRK